MHDLRKTISEILFYLSNDYSIVHNAKIVDKSAAMAAKKNLERLGASLLSGQHLIPFYVTVRKFFSLPKSADIILASKRLSLISNSMFGEEPDIHYKLDIYHLDICKALNIKDPIQGGMSRQELKDAIAELRKNRIQSSHL